MGTSLADAIRQEMWRTPDAPNAGGPRNRQASIGHGHQVTIAEQAEHWQTPAVPNGGRTTNVTNQREDGSKRQIDLGAQASTWATPRAEDAESCGNHPEKQDSLTGQTRLWPTPAQRDYRTPNSSDSQERRNEDSTRGQQLPNFVEHHWPTPTAMDSEQAGGRGATGTTRGPSLHRATDAWQTPATDSFRSRSGDRKDEQGLDQQAREMWPTPAATPYGSSQNGINGKGGEFERLSAGTPSLERLSHSFLPLLQTLTDGDESSPSDQTSRQPLLWPTPRAQEDGSSLEAREARIARLDAKSTTGGPHHKPTGLTQAVEKAQKTPQWPTPRAEDKDSTRTASGNPAKDGRILSNEATRWKTPHGMANTDVHGKTGGGGGEFHKQAMATADQIAPTTKAKLNPQFVEWLMGWPIGHTGN